ncbi:MAG: Gfo/Idh/MocA family oxidoreductase [Candidatus Solibacter sp.]
MVSWLVVGIGEIARKRVVPAILAEPRSRLAGIVTRDPRKAASYGVPAWERLEDALAASEATAVYIATPVFLHEAQSIESLRSGRHVLCEKPMALNYEQALSMQKASEQCRRTLGIAYYRRMYPKVERARELLEAGAIGRPVLAEASAHTWFNPLETAREWLADPAKAGGGPLRDVACHRIDLMTYFFGKPIRATGQRSTLVQPVAVEDNVTLTIEYEGGMRGVVDARWHSRVTRDEFRIRGTDGEISLSPLNGPELVHPGGVEKIPAHANLHYPCIEDFVSAVEHDILPRSYAQSALATEWVMEQVTQGK